MNRITQFAGALGAALLLLAGTVRAEEIRSEDLRDLDGGALARRYIVNGLNLRMQAFEQARRTLLIKRCTALDRQFPKRPSPRTMAVVNAVQKWMIDGSFTSKPKIAGYRGMRLLQDAAFTSGELAQWDRFRKSAQGQRALNIDAVVRAVDVTAESLVDIRTGVPWDWPLANLREMADAADMRPYLDKALDQASAGSAAALAKVSAVPGENRDDAAGQQLREIFLKHSENLQEALLAQLTQADKQALDALDRQPVSLRWEEIASAWKEFVSPETNPDYKITGAPAKLETVAAFCGKLKLPACKPDSPLAQGLENARRNFRDTFSGSEFDAYSQALYEVIKRVPEAGCP